MTSPRIATARSAYSPLKAISILRKTFHLYLQGRTRSFESAVSEPGSSRSSRVVDYPRMQSKRFLRRLACARKTRRHQH